MRKYRVPYLESRACGFHFRIRIPTAYRAILGRTNIRLTLNTRERSVARERIAIVLPHVLSFRRLCRRRTDMNAEQFERAIKFAVKRIVEMLESWNAPWLPRDEDSPEQAEATLFQQAFGFQPNARGARLMQAWAPGTDIDPEYEGEELAELGRVACSTLIDCGGSTLAKNVLATLGIDADESSQLFGDLSVEMGKLHVALRRTLACRRGSLRRGEVHELQPPLPADQGVRGCDHADDQRSMADVLRRKTQRATARVGRSYRQETAGCL